MGEGRVGLIGIRGGQGTPILQNKSAIEMVGIPDFFMIRIRFVIRIYELKFMVVN